MAEKKDSNSIERSTIFVLLALIVVLIGIVIAIPIVYSQGRNQGGPINITLTNVSNTFLLNECTTPLTNVDALGYLVDSEPFPYRHLNYLYRPSVILKEIYIIFGFRHDNKSWSIDEISVNDTTTNDNQFLDGGFESNYLTLHYTRCVLSNTRSSTGDILFDIPYQEDFYYNDQTSVGMAYLTQKISITGGRYYNITFFLENRGYQNNSFLFAIGYIKKS